MQPVQGTSKLEVLEDLLQNEVKEKTQELEEVKRQRLKAEEELKECEEGMYAAHVKGISSRADSLYCNSLLGGMKTAWDSIWHLMLVEDQMHNLL